MAAQNRFVSAQWLDDSVLNDYFGFLRFQSVSTDPTYKQSLEKTVKWLTSKLKSYGLQNVKPLGIKGKTAFTDYNPMVYGEYIVSKNYPTLLFYGHYDVQPADEETWNTNPFEPVLKDGRVYARGASDNKGRVFAILLALRHYIKHAKNKRFNIKVLIEGEEEIGSKHAIPIVESNRELLDHDVLFLNDMTSFGDKPTVVYSLRGLYYAALTFKLGPTDAHSGTFGNLLLNTAQLSAYVVYKLKDIWRNRIRIDGIYKHVRRPSKKEIEQLNRLSSSWEQIKKSTGFYVTTPYRSAKTQEVSPLCLVALFPSLDVHGIKSGTSDEKLIKTNIPHEAVIKFSIRTVPYLEIETVHRLLTRYIEKILKPFKGVKYALECLTSLPYYYEDPESPHMKRFVKIVQKVYGKEPVLVPNGASVGLVGYWKQLFKDIPILIHAVGDPQDRVHGANESFSLQALSQGAEVVKTLLEEYEL